MKEIRLLSLEGVRWDGTADGWACPGRGVGGADDLYVSFYPLMEQVELTSSAEVTAVAAPAGATSAIASVVGAAETLSSSFLPLSFSLSSPNIHAPGTCGPVLILPGIEGRGTFPVSIKLEVGDLSSGLMVPPTGLPVEICPSIGGDREGDTGDLLDPVPTGIGIGLGLLESAPAPPGFIDDFRPAA